MLATLPWVASLLFILWRTKLPRELPSVQRHGVASTDEPDARDLQPSVSVVIPARNEEHNIGRCAASLIASDYRDFEIIVVDDRSEDGTVSAARDVPVGHARRVRVIEGEPLPAGWLGKPWACFQGARAATGEVLLFTDADTSHAPDLLARAVRGLHEERADLLTLVGRQLMETFWERLLQPHVFLAMLYRFPDFEGVARNERWRDAIANGQYIMMPAASYHRLGGHGAVKDQVVEDLALAQHVKRAGMRLRVRSAEDGLSTRMYRSLGELIEGWSKNLIIGGQLTFPRWMRPWVPPVALTMAVVMWLVPPAVLVSLVLARAVGGDPVQGGPDGTAAALFVWAAVAVAASTIQFIYFTRRMGAAPWYGLLYPVAAAVTTYIFLRSWVRGRNVRWKGRDYRVPSASSSP